MKVTFVVKDRPRIVKVVQRTMDVRVGLRVLRVRLTVK